MRLNWRGWPPASLLSLNMENPFEEWPQSGTGWLMKNIPSDRASLLSQILYVLFFLIFFFLAQGNVQHQALALALAIHCHWIIVEPTQAPLLWDKYCGCGSAGRDNLNLVLLAIFRSFQIIHWNNHLLSGRKANGKNQVIQLLNNSASKLLQALHELQKRKSA